MTTEVTHYLCIGCPLGCRLEVEDEAGEIVEVRGFACKRGDDYARQEHLDPRRMVTTTIKVKQGRWARLPVRTTQSIRKAQVLPVCRALRCVTVNAPVKMGQVIVSNILNSGADIVASRDMPIR